MLPLDFTLSSHPTQSEIDVLHARLLRQMHPSILAVLQKHFEPYMYRQLQLGKNLYPSATPVMMAMVLLPHILEMTDVPKHEHPTLIILILWIAARFPEPSADELEKAVLCEEDLPIWKKIAALHNTS